MMIIFVIFTDNFTLLHIDRRIRVQKKPHSLGVDE